MKRIVHLCGDCSQGCPSVAFTESEVILGEGDNVIRLAPEDWDSLVERIKSGELTTFVEMIIDSENASNCG